MVGFQWGCRWGAVGLLVLTACTPTHRTAPSAPVTAAPFPAPTSAPTPASVAAPPPAGLAAPSPEHVAASAPSSPPPAPSAAPLPPSLARTPAPAPAPGPDPAPEPITRTAACSADTANNRATYSRGDVATSAALYQPRGIGPFPAVLVLHTRGGLTPQDRDYAAWLASQGYVALAPDYLTPVGLAPSPSPFPPIFIPYTNPIRDDLVRGLECLKSLPFVAQGRIGVVGFSLGGYFAVLLAGRPDVKGAVAYYVPYAGRPVNTAPTQYTFTDLAAQVRTPLLMLHGDADTEAPIGNARTAQTLLATSGKQAELVVYAGAGHGFNRRPPSPYVYDASAAADAQARVVAFLAAQLK